MIKYEQWNKAIIKHIFEKYEPGEVVFLNTTSDTLREIAHMEGFDTKNAVESLKEAVRKRVAPYNMVRLLEITPKIPEKILVQEPPQVAFLALCVLAASKMDSKDSVDPNDYYSRLNQFLFGQIIKNAPPGFDKPHFEYLWKYLQKWVHYKYDVKLYLTQGSTNEKYAWYPKSQCLISNYDEHKIHAIFKEAKLKPGAYLAETQLLNILCLSKYFKNLSVKIKRPLELKTAEVRLILGQIQLLLENWDDTEQEWTKNTGIKRRKPNTIDVQLKFNPFRTGDIDKIRYWFRCGRSTQINFRPNALNVESLKSNDGKWFEPFSVDVDISSLQMLQNGFGIKSEETKSLTYRLKPSDIWVFRNESEPDDGWFSQGNILLHQLHRIVFRKEQSLRVTSILKHVCDPFSLPKSICVGGEEIGWQYVDVKPTVLCKNTILGYSITTSKQISFVGGLPLDGRKNQYFDFCLPTIVVPDHYTQSDIPIQFSDKNLNVPSNRKIELTEKLDPGEYVLSYLDSQTTLRVISPKCSCDYEKQTFAINIDIKSKNLPSFKDYKISEMSEVSGVWLSGGKFFDEDNIPLFIRSNEETPILSAAELISSVVQVAIKLKKGNISPPKWFHKAIDNLNQDMALRVLVKKKLNDYLETALSYTELCKRIGK